MVRSYVTEMVAAFTFDLARENVLLIKKNRPAWQKGRINGIGGKIEKNEAPHVAMVREFEEETGQSVETFINYAIVNGSGWRVYFYFTIIEPLQIKENPTDEILLIAPVRDLPENILYNLNWLIPLALDEDLLKPTVVYDKTAYNGLKKYFIWED